MTPPPPITLPSFLSHLIKSDNFWTRRGSVFLIAFVLVALLVACGRQTPEPPPPPPPVHDLELPSLLGDAPEPIRTIDFAGRVQFLIFLHTDNESCLDTIPAWNALQEVFGPSGFQVVGIVVDNRPRAALASEAAGLGSVFPIGVGSEDVVAAFGGVDALRAIPTAFLLDRAGNLARAYPGFPPWLEIREDIHHALDGSPLPDRSPQPDPEDEDTP